METLAKLVVIEGEVKGASCAVREGDEVSIGRNLACSIPVPDIKLSRIHCIIRNVKGKFELLDNNSTNGTSVNGHPVEVSYDLQPGDIIEIGNTMIQFLCEES
jgi:pSer/pThr/pTyr-binding forkhead associated (FHA) protein